MLVEAAPADELDGRRPPLVHLLLLLEVGGGREADSLVVEARPFEEPPAGVGGRAVGPRLEASVDVAGPDAELEHHRGAARLGELEALLDRAHHGGQARSGVEEPDLRLHREGVASLLDDARPVAVVLADHDERAAGDPRGREVRERVGGDVGSDGGLPHRASAHRVVDGGGEHGAGGRLVRAGLDVDAERVQDLAGVVEDVHHVGDRCPLVAAHVGHPGLEQGLRDREDPLTVEDVAVAEGEGPNLLRKASFRHVVPPRDARSPGALSRIIGTCGFQRRVPVSSGDAHHDGASRLR